jgi:hypothetical protein
VLKPRQLLQALRRVRHQSIAAGSTTCQTRADADLPAYDSMQKQTGVISVSRPFCRQRYTGLRWITSSALPYNGRRSNLSRCHHSGR